MLGKWWTKKAGGWAGVEVGESGLGFVHVVRDAKGKPQLRRAGFFRKEGSDAEALSSLCQSQGLSRLHCTTLLRTGEYQLVQIEAPKVSPEEIRAAVRWKIKDLLDFSVEDAVIDVLEIPSDRSGLARATNVFVVAAPKSVIQRQVQFFQFAKVPLEVIEVIETAQRNIATLFEHEGRSVALLAFYEQGGLLTFSAAGELLATRRIEIGTRQLQEAVDDARYALFERIGLEMQRSLDAFERQFHFVPVERVLVSPLPENVALAAYLGSNLYVPVEPIMLADVFSGDGVAALGDPVSAMRYFSILGAALRDQGPGR